MMRRKITASFFLMTMSFLIVFQLPVFAYCLCNGEIVSAPCHCEESEKAPSHFDSSHDCDQVIDLQLEPFLTQSQDSEISAPNFVAISPLAEFTSLPLWNRHDTKLAPIRGSPPALNDLPLFLKHSVFRL